MGRSNMVDPAGVTKYAYFVGCLLNTDEGPWASDSVSYPYNKPFAQFT